MIKKVEISHKTILFGIFVLLSLLFFYRIADILLQFFVALLVMFFLNPYVEKMFKYKIPRGISIILAYLLVIAVLVVSISSIVPPLVEQTSSFASNLPVFLGNVGLSSDLGSKIIEQLVTQLGSLPKEIAKFTVSIFSNILSLVTILVFSFYLLLERNKLSAHLNFLFDEKMSKKVGGLFDNLENKLGGWARGQLTLMLVIGSATYICLTILGFPYALPLSIIAGLLELIPYIGPFLSAIPAVLIGLGISPLMAIAAASVYFLVQQLENYVFVPKIMQRSAGVHPIITLLSLSIGFRLAGIVGLLMSVPIFISVRVILGEFVFNKDR